MNSGRERLISCLELGLTHSQAVGLFNSDPQTRVDIDHVVLPPYRSSIQFNPGERPVERPTPSALFAAALAPKKGHAGTCPLGERCVARHGAHDQAADHPPQGALIGKEEKHFGDRAEEP